MTYAICSSKLFIYKKFTFVIKKWTLPKFNYSSCHALDASKKYDKHLESKDLSYDLIMRSVKMITNFARTGWVQLKYTNMVQIWFIWNILVIHQLKAILHSNRAIQLTNCFVKKFRIIWRQVSPTIFESKHSMAWSWRNL